MIKAVSTFGATPGITSSLNVGAVSIGGSCYKDVNDQIHCISSPIPAELAATNLTHVFALADSSMPICYRTSDGHLLCDELVIGNSYQSPTSLEGVASIVFSENGGHWCTLKTDRSVVCDALASWTTPPE